MTALGKRRQRVLAQTAWAIRTTLRVAPKLYAASVGVTLLLALVPSMQVILVTKMARAVAVDDMSLASSLAVAVGLMVAGYLAARQVMYSLQRMTQVAFRASALERIDDALSRLSPANIVNPETQTSARTAREAILEGKVQMQATSALSALFSIVVATSLSITIGQQSPWAAVLIVACLAPMALSAMWYSKIDAVKWPLISKERRLASYREDQLIYQSTAIELATFDSRGMMAHAASVHHRGSRDHEMSLERSGLVADALAGIVSSMFLVGAFIALINSGVDAALLTGSAVGILSGIMATSDVGFVVGSLMSGSNAVTRYREFVEVPLSVTRHPVVEDVAEVNVRNMTVQYDGTSAPSLSQVSFGAKKGGILAVVGANGAGKTTLVRGLVGLVESVQGDVHFNEVAMSGTSFEERLPSIALLSQEFGRYELTVRENLLLATQGLDPGDERLWAALKTARADEFVAQLPDGLDTQLGEQWGGVGLSVGQWQRLSIARLILRGASIWILDEPTSAIDAEAEERILGELQDLAENHVIIFISHRAWTLRSAREILVLDKGRVVQQGDYPSLLNTPGRFRELFASQT